MAALKTLAAARVARAGCWGTQYFKNFPTITQDLFRRCIAMRGKSVSTYPRRPKAEALRNVVDVVEHLCDPTDRVPNARHLRDLHIFSSATSLVLLIQLRPRESFVSKTV